ncbi:3693_t:CDS:2, partial [Paraglomus brasilianum]
NDNDAKYLLAEGIIFAKRELDNGRWETEIGAPILRSLIISTIVLLDLSIPNDPPDTTMLDPRWFLAQFMCSEPLLWTDPECKCTTI